MKEIDLVKKMINSFEDKSKLIEKIRIKTPYFLFIALSLFSFNKLYEVFKAKQSSLLVPAILGSSFLAIIMLVFQIIFWWMIKYNITLSQSGLVLREEKEGLFLQLLHYVCMSMIGFAIIFFLFPEYFK